MEKTVSVLRVYDIDGEYQFTEVHDNSNTLDESIDLIKMEGDLQYEIEDIVVNEIQIG